MCAFVWSLWLWLDWLRLSPFWYSDKGIIWRRHPEIHLVGTMTCVALKRKKWNQNYLDDLWHLLAWAVQWCPCRFSGSSLEVEQIPNHWSLKSWDFLWQILPFHLSSQTLWRSSRSACSRCSHEVRRLKSLLELVQVITKAETCLLTWSGQNDEHIREQIPCRAWRYNSIQCIFQKSEKISRDWLNCNFDYLVRIFLHCGWKVFGNGMSVVTFNRKTH